MARRVLVVGAGIAGLASASFLTRFGFEVTVIERASQPAAEGAGIQISPNAAHVLDALGILNEAIGSAIAPSAIELIDGPTRTPLSSFELGPNVIERYGAPYLVLERSALRDLIAAGPFAQFETLHSTPLESLDPNGRPRADFAGRTHRYDLVIGADGVGSTVRDHFENGASVRPTGWTAWRCLGESAATDRTLVRLHPHKHRVTYSLPNGRNEVWIKKQDEGSPGPGWHPWPVLQVDHRGPWSESATVLIGDAAHAMPPYAAQGGAMALEDAAVLSAALVEDGDIPGAIAKYESERRGRIAAIARLTKANRRIYHMEGPLRLARNVAMRLAPQTALQRRMAWIYSWRPPVILSSTPTR